MEEEGLEEEEEVREEVMQEERDNIEPETTI